MKQETNEQTTGFRSKLSQYLDDLTLTGKLTLVVALAGFALLAGAIINPL